MEQKDDRDRNLRLSKQAGMGATPWFWGEPPS
jgi:hypothetical protein